MKPLITVSRRSLILNGALGAIIGALCVGLALSLDVMDIGSMIGQTDYSWIYLTLIVFKPMKTISVR